MEQNETFLLQMESNDSAILFVEPFDAVISIINTDSMFFRVCIANHIVGSVGIYKLPFQLLDSQSIRVHLHYLLMRRMEKSGFVWHCWMEF